jgi:hypothetical protein
MCSTVGYRSSEEAKRLSKQGIDARNLRGGILAWVRTHACTTLAPLACMSCCRCNRVSVVAA